MLRKYLLILILLFSCSKPEAPRQASQLRISFNTFPQSADPRTCNDFLGSTLVSMIFEGLTKCSPSGEIELALADHIEISDDQLRYTFHLRPSLWSDGTQATAFDFERTWKQILTPGFPSNCPYLLYCIQNARLAHQGLKNIDEIGVHAIDENTLEVVLEHPTPYFLSLTATTSYWPAPIQRSDLFLTLESGQTIVSNGAFCVKSVQPNSEILLQKNQNYWNKQQIKLDEIRISIISNENTAWQMFEQGELDLLGGVIAPFPIDSIQKIRSCTHLQNFPMAATTICTFQTKHPYLQNQNLRRALSLAINRTKIVEQITQLGEMPATRCIPPALIGDRNKIYYQPFDPEFARLHLQKALDELKIDSKQLNTLILSFRSTQLNRQIAQAMQRQWKETLDLDIELEQIESSCFREKMQRHDYQMALNYWIAQFNDPINILERFQDAGNVKNYPGWFNEDFSRLVDQASVTSDPLKRLYLIEHAEQILLEEMPFAPIYHWSNPNLSQPWVINLQTTPNGAVLFEQCSLTKH